MRTAGLLGWKVGPPPIVLVRVGERYFALPSNARLGEFGHSVGLDSTRRIRGVGTW